VVTDRHACLTAADNDSLDLLAHDVKIGVGSRSGIAEITHPCFTAWSFPAILHPQMKMCSRAKAVAVVRDDTPRGEWSITGMDPALVDRPRSINSESPA
jgi:hypothetical protein